MDLSGVLWLVVDVLLVAALGAGIAYAIMKNKRRDHSRDAESDAVTRKLYNPDVTSSDLEKR